MKTRSWIAVCAACSLFFFVLGRATDRRAQEATPRVASDKATQAPMSAETVIPPPTMTVPVHRIQQSSMAEVFKEQRPERRVGGPPDAHERVREASLARERRYSPFFGQAGLTPDQSRELLDRLENLHLLAISAGDPMTELVMAKASYDRHIQEVLGPDNYEAYRAFEARKPYENEVAALARFSAGSGHALTEEEKAGLVGLLGRFGLSDKLSADGPYDAPPVPLVGNEAMATHSQATIKRFSEGYAQMEETPEWQELPQHVRSIVAEYLVEQIDRKRELIERSKLTREERFQKIMEKEGALLREIANERGQGGPRNN